MKALQFFTHRPASAGVHLLSDPFPERLNYSTSMFARATNLSAQREYIAASRRPARAGLFGKP